MGRCSIAEAAPAATSNIVKVMDSKVFFIFIFLSGLKTAEVPRRGSDPIRDVPKKRGVNIPRGV
jgi:hypothetical protein